MPLFLSRRFFPPSLPLKNQATAAGDSPALADFKHDNRPCFAPRHIGDTLPQADIDSWSWQPSTNWLIHLNRALGNPGMIQHQVTLPDLLSDSVVQFASLHASKSADEDPFHGNERLRAAASLIVSAR